jgi:ABC-type amino acid transport system permease subunit
MLSTRARWGYRAVAIAPALAFAATVVLTRGYQALPAPDALVTRTAAATVILAWSIGWALFLWHRSDEFRHAAQKFAWFWGGLGGLMVSVPIFAFIGVGGLGLVSGGLPVHRAFALGYRLAVMPQFIGLFVALIYWRKAKS